MEINNNVFYILFSIMIILLIVTTSIGINTHNNLTNDIDKRQKDIYKIIDMYKNTGITLSAEDKLLIDTYVLQQSKGYEVTDANTAEIVILISIVSVLVGTIVYNVIQSRKVKI